MASLTVENYVKAIYQIGASNVGGPAATGQLAAALGVSPGTVTSMLKTLSEGGLATYTPITNPTVTMPSLSIVSVPSVSYQGW